MISYSDSEVKRFHPLCEKAIREALEQVGLANTYEPVHHRHVGTLEMDFSVENLTTRKCLCVIEVKRTPSAVLSARNQYQAMSYVQMNATSLERPYYLLTNIESAMAFRYDTNRPRVFQQILAPGYQKLANLTEHDEPTLVSELASYLAKQFEEFTHDRFAYSRTLSGFAERMEKSRLDSAHWKSDLAFLLYEYIRGAFLACNRTELKDIRLFRSNLSRICEEAARVNFSGIFSRLGDVYNVETTPEETLLEDLFELGHTNISGDSVAEVLHQIVSRDHEHDGEVSTDYDLGLLVGRMALHELERPLSPDGLLCDPAAGSGSLLSAAADVFTPEPSQLVANDVNPWLVELLSLRMGLKFARTVGANSSPLVSSRSIAEYSASNFANVEVVVMNPPFVAGINCSERKQPLFNAIERITGRPARTKLGQMPLEAPFLELVSSLVARGTVVACVFPTGHLVARGAEARVIRELLLNDFGLRCIFTYPGRGVFANVTKSTCVLVGKPGHEYNDVRIVSSYTEIPNLNEYDLNRALEAHVEHEFSAVAPGLDARRTSLDELRENLEDGWRFLNREMYDAQVFFRETIAACEVLETIAESGRTLRRGSVGNSGASDLAFFSTCKLYDSYHTRNLALRPGMKNSKHATTLVGEGDARFLDVIHSDPQVIEELLEEYQTLKHRTSRQQRKTKTRDELLAILKKEADKACRNSVLIPRGIRNKGRVYLATNDTFVSTNFCICEGLSADDALILTSWMQTVFYQLNCELASKNQEGMRKMEISDVLKTYAPCPGIMKLCDLKSLNESMLEHSDFVDLRNPSVRAIDRLWAHALFGDRANDVIKECLRHLRYLIDQRSS